MLEAKDVVLCRAARLGLARRMEQFGGWFALSAATSAPDAEQTTLAAESTEERVEATMRSKDGIVRYEAQVVFGADGRTVGQLALMTAQTSGEPIAIAHVVPIETVAGRPYRLYLEVDFTA